MMKVLFISSGIHLDGFSKSLVYLIECLQARGVEVDLLLLRRTEDEWLLERLRPLKVLGNGLTREFANEERSLLMKAYSLLRTRRIWNRARGLFLRRVVYRGAELPRSLALTAMQLDAERRARGLRARLRLIDYDCVVSWEESLCNYILATSIEAKRRIGYIHPDYAEAGFDPVVDRRMLRGLDAIAFVTESSRNSFCRAIPELSSRTITIPNVLGVSTIRELASMDAVGMERSGFSIVTVCRLQNISKALDRAARVCARMKAEGLRFRWFIIGTGPDEEMIAAQVRELDIANEMVLLGEQDNPYPYVRAADLFVLQSYYEGRPLVVDEAKILGTPVFVTDYASARTQVRQGDDGFVVANDENAIFHGLSDIVRNPDRLGEIRTRLNARDWDEFSDCSGFLQACSASLRSEEGRHILADSVIPGQPSYLDCPGAPNADEASSQSRSSTCTGDGPSGLGEDPSHVVIPELN